MRQFSLAALLIEWLPDHVLASLTQDDLHTLIDAMRAMAGRAETDAALERLLHYVDHEASVHRPISAHHTHVAGS
jgi:hypothetical protein